jgi:predicted deacylase
MNIIDSFSRNYSEARARFLEAVDALEAPAALETVDHPLRGPNDEALATDVALVGDPNAAKVLILISGTHGTEGACGSACQNAWLRSDRPDNLPDDIRVVLIHAINPHGFAHVRRVTEDNVDLNRNFLDHGAPHPENLAYTSLHDLLMPTSWSLEARAEADKGLEAYAAEHGQFALQAAISRGQFSHPNGLFFGGHAPTWSNRTLRMLLTRHAGHADAVGLIDFHTGLGPHGTAELISDAAPDSEDYQRLERWYANGLSSPSAGTSTSAPLSGTMGNGVRECLPDTRLSMITAEFGTYPVRRVFNALRGDHWLHANGTDDEVLRKAIKDEVTKALYPDEDDWKELVGLRGRQLIDRAIAGLARDA